MCKQFQDVYLGLHRKTFQVSKWPRNEEIYQHINKYIRLKGCSREKLNKLLMIHV